MEPPSRIILPYIEESANIVYTEASHLLVNCTLLTNKRTIYLSIYLSVIANLTDVPDGSRIESKLGLRPLGEYRMKIMFVVNDAL